MSEFWQSEFLLTLIKTFLHVLGWGHVSSQVEWKHMFNFVSWNCPLDYAFSSPTALKMRHFMVQETNYPTVKWASANLFLTSPFVFFPKKILVLNFPPTHQMSLSRFLRQVFFLYWLKIGFWAFSKWLSLVNAQLKWIFLGNIIVA